MNTRIMYCSACGREVDVTWTPMPTHEGHAPIPDGPELVCLDLNAARCNGTCPITNLSHAAMQARLTSTETEDE